MSVPAVSVIIPVFNVEKHIGTCVESVLHQTFSDFELVLVDDGSTDNSGRIIDGYTEIDSRVLAFHKNNSGASATRNYGLSQARGRWIVFVDSDDYVGEKYLEDLINNAESDCLVIQGLTKVSDGDILGDLQFRDDLYEGKDIIKLFDSKDFFDRGFPVSKVFDKNVINAYDIKFNANIHYSEDLIFTLEYVRYARKVITMSGSNYYYQVNNSNLSRKYNSFASEYELFDKFSSLTSEIAQEYGCIQSETAKIFSALMLMRCVYAMYVNCEFSRRDRYSMVKKIRVEKKTFVKQYYLPQIILFKFAKKLFLINPVLFHLFCLAKF